MGNNSECMTDTEKIKCDVCCIVLDIRNGVILTQCNHVFCKKCIKRLFEHALDGVFKCCVEFQYKMCQKLVMKTTIKEIYNISQLTGSILVEERKHKESPSIQNEQIIIDESDSTRENEESTSNEYNLSTGQNENTKNKQPNYTSQKQEPETSRSNDEGDKILKYEEHEKPMTPIMSHEMKNYQDATQCRNPECKVWLYYGVEQYSKKFFTCPDCKQRNCFLCKGLHNPEAITCAEYEQTLKNTSKYSEDLVKKMLENNEAMLCPTCKETLLKDDGCDFITCFWCKVELCWVTRGYRWGAWGPGDTSGGCRCGVDGIKCHPDCRSCH